VLLSRSQPASAAPPIAKAAKVVHVAALRIGPLHRKTGFAVCTCGGNPRSPTGEGGFS
jgi:hypothetical protein